MSATIIECLGSFIGSKSPAKYNDTENSRLQLVLRREASVQETIRGHLSPMNGQGQPFNFEITIELEEEEQLRDRWVNASHDKYSRLTVPMMLLSLVPRQCKLPN